MINIKQLFLNNIFLFTELRGYVRSLLGVEGAIFNVIPIAQLLGLSEESINQIVKTHKDEDEDLERILQHWSKRRDLIDDLAVLRKNLGSLKQKGKLSEVVF